MARFYVAGLTLTDRAEKGDWSTQCLACAGRRVLAREITVELRQPAARRVRLMVEDVCPICKGAGKVAPKMATAFEAWLSEEQEGA